MSVLQGQLSIIRAITRADLEEAGVLSSVPTRADTEWAAFDADRMEWICNAHPIELEALHGIIRGRLREPLPVVTDRRGRMVFEIDHVDGNPRNNDRANLRCVEVRR